MVDEDHDGSMHVVLICFHTLLLTLTAAKILFFMRITRNMGLQVQLIFNVFSHFKSFGLFFFGLIVLMSLLT